MSLVNDMLKDLDRRKRLVTGSVPSVFAGDQDSEQNVFKYWKIMLLVVTGILVGIGGGFVFFQGEQESTFEREFTTNSQQGGVVQNAGFTERAGNAESEAQNVSGQSGFNDRGVSIFADSNTAAGFVLRVVSINDFPFEILSRKDNGIEVLLSGIGKVSQNEVNFEGLRVLATDSGLKISITMKEQFEFLVYEESNMNNSVGQSMIIEGLARDKVVPEYVNPLTASDQPVDTSPGKPTPAEEVENLPANKLVDDVPVKTSRVLSLEERDINLSKKAASLIQRGQIIDAYAELLGFIEENSEAHHSRETLATLLFAQQEYQQAGVIIEQGLQLAPNYSAYKKMKARLLLLNSEPAAAANYLIGNPPVLANDPEYFELLASAYQQNMQHGDAIQTYQNLIRYDSQQARWWVGMGISLEAEGDVDDAISSYQAALQNAELDSALRQYSQNRIRFLRN